MKKKILPLAVAIFFLSGCSITTIGESSREIYIGIRTKQHSEQPAKTEIQSSVVDKFIDSLQDGKTTPAE